MKIAAFWKSLQDYLGAEPQKAVLFTLAAYRTRIFTLNPCSSLNARHYVSHPNKATRKITVSSSSIITTTLCGF
jgi:hypothetical protein